MIFMIKFTTQELEMESNLKQRIEFICEFCHTTPKIIKGTDEFQMEDINSAFNYIPDETNDSVVYLKEPIPIEIGVKPVNIETMKKDSSSQG